MVVRRDGWYSSRVPADWRERFIRAYDIEMQEWVNAPASGSTPTGPSSWDGYAAAAVSDAAVEALHRDTRVPVDLADKPDLYAKEQQARSHLSAPQQTSFLVFWLDEDHSRSSR